MSWIKGFSGLYGLYVNAKAPAMTTPKTTALAAPRMRRLRRLGLRLLDRAPARVVFAVSLLGLRFISRDRPVVLEKWWKIETHPIILFIDNNTLHTNNQHSPTHERLRRVYIRRAKEYKEIVPAAQRRKGPKEWIMSLDEVLVYTTTN